MTLNKLPFLKTYFLTKLIYFYKIANFEICRKKQRRNCLGIMASLLYAEHLKKSALALSINSLGIALIGSTYSFE